MKNHLVLFLAFLFLIPSLLSAQEPQSGQVLYEQMVSYNLEGAYDSPSWTDYIANLPRQGKAFQILSFVEDQSIYEEDLSKKEPLSENLQKAISKADYYRPPQPVSQAIFFDFDKELKVEQVAFMTRNFLISSSTN